MTKKERKNREKERMAQCLSIITQKLRHAGKKRIGRGRSYFATSNPILGEKKGEAQIGEGRAEEKKKKGASLPVDEKKKKRGPVPTT